jgi:dihydropteroate synthase
MATSLKLVASPALPRGLSHLGGELVGRLYLGPACTGDSTFFHREERKAPWRVLLRQDEQVVETVSPLSDVLDWARREGESVACHVEAILAGFRASGRPFAGLSLEAPRIMGIVNVTPDSFSDGGRFFVPDAAVAHGLALREAGADILDVGGESTRPGAPAVPPDEEARRVLPVVRALAERGLVVSIDTRNAAVMAAAVDCGAAIINDVTALAGDPRALSAAAGSRAAIVLMHMQGEPRSMQTAPHYAFAPLDVFDFLAERLAACRAAGIAADRLCIDPGIGFGKTVEHNLQIVAHLSLYCGLGTPLLLGVSRKSFIAKLSRGEQPGDRIAGSLAAALAGLDRGARILRVHDVAETAQALAMWQGIRRAAEEPSGRI